MNVIGWLLTCLAVAMTAVAARYAFFALVALVAPPPAPIGRRPTTLFCALVPAHNEGAGIAATIEALREQNYPPELWRILVLADNCTDDTAAIARDCGVDVIERCDELLTGKGEAVRWAVTNHFATDEALFICDADSRPAADYLLWMDRALGRGYGAAQGFNGTANPEASSLAALAAITGGMKNRLQYAGKTSAGLPAPLMNGLCLAASTLQRFGWQSFSVAEDFETYLRLVDADVPIRFVPEAKILSFKVGSFAAAAEQKARWSGGQSKLGMKLGLPVLLRGLAQRKIAKVEAALDLLLPGYAPTTGLLFVVAVAGALLFPGQAHPAVGLAAAGLLLMIAQFAVGLTLIRWTPKTALAIALTPVYIFWKLVLSMHFMVFSPQKWKRARRDTD